MSKISGSSSVGKTNQTGKVENESKKTTVSSSVKTNSLKTEDAAKTTKLKELEATGSAVKSKLMAKTATPKEPTFSKEATVTKVGDKTVIQTNGTDDKINITQDAKTGKVTVEVNGEKQTFSGKDKNNLVIKAGDGNDTITIDKNVKVKVTVDGQGGNDEISVNKDSKTGHNLNGGDGDDKINGGSGNDNIKGGNGNDTIEAGAGNDTVDGGAGRDYINGSKGDDTLNGGTGDDVVYGGDGNDKIKGGDGNDYLEGSKGNDTIEGQKGNDIISGGLGNDTLKGGDNDDTIYAGKGKDKVFGDKGKNDIYAEKGDTVQKNGKGITNTVVTVDLSKAVGSNVVVEGSDEFKERVEADLEMLRSSPVGRKMLESFDDTKKTVTIKESTTGNSATFPDRGVTGKPQPWYNTATSTNGDAVNGIVSYNPSRVTVGGNDRPPIVGLFHEMAHAWDYTHGTLRDGTYNGSDAADNGQNIRERVAVGLPIDHDNDPKTAEVNDPLHSYDYTENALRDELNLDKREHYNN